MPFIEKLKAIKYSIIFLEIKKKKRKMFWDCVYARFLRINTDIRANPNMIATMMPAIAGTKY